MCALCVGIQQHGAPVPAGTQACGDSQGAARSSGGPSQEGESGQLHSERQNMEDWFSWDVSGEFKYSICKWSITFILLVTEGIAGLCVCVQEASVLLRVLLHRVRLQSPWCPPQILSPHWHAPCHLSFRDRYRHTHSPCASQNQRDVTRGSYNGLQLSWNCGRVIQCGTSGTRIRCVMVCITMRISAWEQ